jgi:hypothetical protein
MNSNDTKRHNAAMQQLEERVPIMKALAVKRQVAENENLPLPERQQAQADINYHQFKLEDLAKKLRKTTGSCYPELVAAWTKKVPHFRPIPTGLMETKLTRRVPTTSGEYWWTNGKCKPAVAHTEKDTATGNVFVRLKGEWRGTAKALGGYWAKITPPKLPTKA